MSKFSNTPRRLSVLSPRRENQLKTVDQTNLETILLQAGYSIAYEHRRCWTGHKRPLSAEEGSLARQQGATLCETGGLTIALIWKDGVPAGFGEARCNQDDKFNRHFGLDLALRRAVDSIVDQYIAAAREVYQEVEV